jgi:hypothetical protein
MYDTRHGTSSGVQQEGHGKAAAELQRKACLLLGALADDDVTHAKGGTLVYKQYWTQLYGIVFTTTSTYRNRKPSHW